MPIRSMYDRLYLKGITAYFRILGKKGMYNQIIEMAENAVQIKPYEEIINLYLIEALMKVGKKRYATAHYQYYSSKLYNDLGLTPSNQMKGLYKRLQTYEDNSPSIINLGILGKKLVEDFFDKGATICDTEHFRFLHNQEIKKKHRNPNPKEIFLGLVTIDSKGPMPLSKDETKIGMDALLKVIYSNLRKGDVATKWNDGQLALILYSLKEQDLNNITQRLKDNFHRKIGDDGTTINIKYNPL